MIDGKSRIIVHDLAHSARLFDMYDCSAFAGLSEVKTKPPPSKGPVFESRSLSTEQASFHVKTESFDVLLYNAELQKRLICPKPSQEFLSLQLQGELRAMLLLVF